MRMNTAKLAFQSDLGRLYLYCCHVDANIFKSLVGFVAQVLNLTGKKLLV